jgi:hypothetical protein
MATETYSRLLDLCDRTRSKFARVSLQRILWGPLQNRGIKLESSCPLSAEADVLRAQEEGKHQLRQAHWQCALCGKEFRSEHFLDKHLCRKHAMLHYVDESAASTCFANLCGVAVPCPPLSDEIVPPVSSSFILDPRQGSRVGDSHSAEARALLCTDHAEVLEQRHRCSNMIRKCITPLVMGSEANAIQEQARLQKLLCMDSKDVECMSHRDRFRWGQKSSSEPELILRHALGWLLLFILAIVFVLGRLTKPYKFANSSNMPRISSPVKVRQRSTKVM